MLGSWLSIHNGAKPFDFIFSYDHDYFSAFQDKQFKNKTEKSFRTVISNMDDKFYSFT